MKDNSRRHLENNCDCKSFLSHLTYGLKSRPLEMEICYFCPFLSWVKSLGFQITTLTFFFSFQLLFQDLTLCHNYCCQYTHWNASWQLEGGAMLARWPRSWNGDWLADWPVWLAQDKLPPLGWPNTAGLGPAR